MEPALLQNAAGTRRVCLFYAALGVVLVWFWQAATVQFNYGGDWTALFCTASTRPVPPELASSTYVVRNSSGYDGQYYRYVAHDPWFQKPWGRSFDSRVWRYRVILVPGLAWLLAGGQSRYIDAAYEGVILSSVFAGIYWLGRYAASCGWHAAWGLGFVLLPATLISIDRMTVDLTLTALCAGFVWYARKDALRPLFLILVLAALTRENGLLLIGASCLDSLWKQKWRRALLLAAAALPTLAWYGWITTMMPRLPGTREGLNPGWLFGRPVIGIFLRLFHPVSYPFDPAAQYLIQLVDTVALCGVVLALMLALWSLWRQGPDNEQWVILLYIGLFVMTSGPGFWNSVYGYSRPFTPLFFLLGLRALRGGPWFFAGPIVLVDLRVLLQFGPQIAGVLGGLVQAVTRL